MIPRRNAGGRAEHQRDLPLRRLREPRRDLLRGPAYDFLVAFRQLTAEGDGALGLCRRQRAKRRRQALRRLERDHGERPRAELVPQCPQRLSAARQEAEELVSLRAEAARNERRLRSRRAREHRDRHARVERRGDEPGAGIADSRQPGIADEREPLASLCSWYESSRAEIPWRSSSTRV